MPALDGMRGVASIMVVVGHFFSNAHPFYKQMPLTRLMAYVPDYFGFGNFGVVLFFCLSSFLLSFLFVREFDKYRKNNVKWFFFRRSLRIWPLYFCFLLIINLAVYFQLLPAETYTQTKIYLERYNVLLFTYLPNWIYATNIFVDGVPSNTGFLNVLWSLGVEEQIYILFPFVAGLLLVSRRRLPLIIILITLSCVSRIIYIILCKLTLNGGMYYSTLSYIDIYLIAGIFGAFHARNEHSIFDDLISSKYTFIAALVLLSIFMHQLQVNGLPPYHASVLITYPILGILASYFLIFVVRSDGGIIARILSVPFSRVCGFLAYSAYIWHVFILMFLNHYFFETNLYSPHGVANSISFQACFFLLYLGLIFSISCLSHGFIELPFLRIKENFSVTGGVNIFSWKRYFACSITFSGFMFCFLWCLR